MLYNNLKRLLLAAFIVLIPSQLPADDIKQGRKTFKQRCIACHTIISGAKNKLGPNIYGIIGSKVASNKGYASRYSKALKAYGGVWTPERMDAFLKKPRAEVKGTKMSLPGIKDDKVRASLIAFLNSQSDKPAKLADKKAAKEEKPEDSNSEPEFGVLVSAKGAEETYNYCIACHSEKIVAQQGLTRDGWIEMLEWMVDEQGMDKIEEPDYTLIVDYLTKNYGPDRPNFPRK